MERTKASSGSETNVIVQTSNALDNNLQMEQHLYRKHLHIATPGAERGMLIFLIAFVCFNLESRKSHAEGI